MLNKKNIVICILAGLIMMLFLPCFSENSVEPKIPMKEILIQFTSYAKQAKKEWHIPGMAIAIVKDDKIIYAQGFGERNAKGAPVTPNTIFNIASLTKSFTAALLAMQIDEGKYTWDTKILKLYPKFKLYDSNTTKEFEVRDLIAHDSGLPEDSLDSLGNFGYSVDHTLYALRFIKPVAPFRTTFAYQDVFLEYARKIIQQISGESYTANLHQKIFYPLHMDNSFVAGEVALRKQDNVAQPFVYYAGKIYPYSMNSPYLSKKWAFEVGQAGGGIDSSAIDVAKWLIFNMNNGAVGNKQLISVKNMNFIHSPQTAITTSSSEASLHGESKKFYGEGWFIDTQEYKPYTLFYHSGGGTGVHALMAYIPQKKIGIVILTNTWGNKVPEALYQRFFDIYFDKKPLKDWNKLFLEERLKAIAHEKTASKPDQCQVINVSDLKKYVGTYNNPVYGNLLMSRQGRHLSLNIGPQSIKWELTPCKNNVFKVYWPNLDGMNIPMLPIGQDIITFSIRKNGSIDKMTIPFLNGNGNGVFLKKQ